MIHARCDVEAVDRDSIDRRYIYPRVLSSNHMLSVEGMASVCSSTRREPYSAVTKTGS